ncbi:MAG: bacillithiol biosynthesis cysteine-adding enzyme BshC, partial [Bacteroidetes bacterium QH_2_67_10]
HHRLKARAAPLFRREIRAPRTSAEHVREAGRRLEDAGGHAQIGARPVNLFLLEEEGRLPLDLSSADDEPLFSVRGTERFASRDELLDLLEEAPERFSPGVVLRPLMQDRLLPTAAYVAGPAEVAYHGQLGGVYEEAGVERPLVYPRASVTLLEGKVAKVLKKFDLGPADLEGDPERLFQSIVERDMEVDLDALFDAAQPPIHQALDDLKPEVEAVDGTLGPSVEATRAEIAGALDDLKAKAMRAEKRSHDEVRAQLEKARANLFPDGAPQERVVNVLYFLNKYGGAAFLDDLHDALSLDTRAHQVVSI